MLTLLPKEYSRLDSGRLFGILLSVTTLMSGILLTGISGWFITNTWLTGSGVLSLVDYNFFLPGAIIRFLAIGRPVLIYYERIFTHRITFQLSGNSRIWLFQNILRKKRNEIIRFRKADLALRITCDLEEMDDFYLRSVLPWTSAFIAFFTTSVIAYFYLPSLALVMTLLFLCCGIITPYLTLRAGRNHESLSLLVFRELQEGITGYTEGLRHLEFFGYLLQYTNELKQKTYELGKLRFQFYRTLAFYNAVSGAGIHLSVCSCLIIISLDNHKFSGPLIVLIMLMMTSLTECLYILPESGARLARTFAAGKRLNEICRTKQPGLSYQPFPADHNITIDNLIFNYGIRPLFDGLSFTINQHSVTVLTGPNGAGKSTLLDLIAGLQQQHGGMIYLGGIQINQIDPIELAKNTGYLEQRVTLFSGTIFDNIALAKKGASEEEVIYAATNAGLIRNPETAKIYLHTDVGESGAKMSAGEARMIAIARIILHEASILFLDEPTEGLSKSAAQNFLRLVASWRGSKTILMVTHKSEVADIADKIISLDPKIEQAFQT